MRKLPPIPLPAKRNVRVVDLAAIQAACSDKFWHADVQVSEEDGKKIFEISSIHAFTQVIGYIKFKLGDHFNVMYRGQHQNFHSLKPSIFRAGSSARSISVKNEYINGYLVLAKKENIFIDGTPEYAFEPLLQHYGLNTRWIDLVDNHWIALWFGAQKFYQTRDGYGIHCEQRNSRNSPDSNSVYIVLVATPKFWMDSRKPGLYSDSDSKLIDLRTCSPSIYLRPHSQHAYLISRNSYSEPPSSDLWDRVPAIIKIDLSLVKEWLGVGGLISSHSLFPPPYYDFGYSRFLECRPKYTSELGTITNFYGSV